MTLDIGLVHPELIYPRGAEKQLCKLACNLRKKGHQVTIYTFEKSGHYIFDELLEGCKVVSLEKNWAVKGWYANYPRWLSMSRALALRMSPDHDILNCHNFPAPWTSSFSGKPFVWMCNEPAYPYFRFRDARPYSPGSLALSAFRRLDRFLCRKIKAVACLDTRMLKLISGIYPDLRMKLTGSGAELDRPVRRTSDDSFDLLFVGALDPFKRPMDILEAASRIKGEIPLRLHMVGEGKLRQPLEERARELKLDARFYGNVPDDELYRLYSLADIAVYVPQDQAWGIFPLESLLAGIPTILSDQCGVLDVLKGVPVVRTGDIRMLADSILSVAKNPDDYLTTASENRKNIERNYNWAAYTDRMIGLFEETLEG